MPCRHGILGAADRPQKQICEAQPSTQGKQSTRLGPRGHSGGGLRQGRAGVEPPQAAESGRGRAWRLEYRHRCRPGERERSEREPPGGNYGGMKAEGKPANGAAEDALGSATLKVHTER